MNLIDIFYLRDKHGYGPHKFCCSNCGECFSSYNELQVHKKKTHAVKRVAARVPHQQQKKMRRERMGDIQATVSLPLPNVCIPFIQ